MANLSKLSKAELLKMVKEQSESIEQLKNTKKPSSGIKFAKGFFVQKQDSKKFSASINVYADDAAEFLKANADDKGICRLYILETESDKGAYIALSKQTKKQVVANEADDMPF